MSRFVEPYHPDTPVALAVLKLLQHPESLDPAARIALIDTVPLLSSASAPGLVNRANPDINAGALLGIEQPPFAVVNTKGRVPVAIASKAILFPGRRIHQMAATSLMTPDPTDKNRQAAGIKALCVAAGDPNDWVAFNALDMLQSGFCGQDIRPVQPNGLVIDRLVGRNKWSERPPSPKEKALKDLLDACDTGSQASRLTAIGKMGTSPDDYVGSGWYQFQHNLFDPDPKIRAAAFMAVRSVVIAAVNNANGIPTQQP